MTIFFNLHIPFLVFCKRKKRRGEQRTSRKNFLSNVTIL